MRGVAQIARGSNEQLDDLGASRRMRFEPADAGEIFKGHRALQSPRPWAGA